MVRLAELPPKAVIDGFKGKIDFYLYKGIPCARKWPVHAPRSRSDAEKATQQAFVITNQTWAQVSPEVKQAYKRMTRGGPWAAKDFFVKGYISGLHREMASP